MHARSVVTDHKHEQNRLIFNPRWACAVRVTVVAVSVCLSVCVCVGVCVCPLSHISSLGHLFILKALPRTKRATEVKKFVAFFLKLFHCID